MLKPNVLPATIFGLGILVGAGLKAAELGARSSFWAPVVACAAITVVLILSGNKTSE